MDRRSLAVSIMLPENWSESLAADDASRACEKCGIKFSLLQRKVIVNFPRVKHSAISFTNFG